MVKHVVLWNLKPEQDKSAVVKEMRGIFAGFQADVPGLMDLNINGGFAGYDICLISLHEDNAALDAYQQHPGHLKAKEYVHSVICERASIDFETE